jgi:3-methyladenine DNA glycosylase Tag
LRRIFAIKFHENPFGGSQVITHVQMQRRSELMRDPHIIRMRIKMKAVTVWYEINKFDTLVLTVTSYSLSRIASRTSRKEQMLAYLKHKQTWSICTTEC